MLTVNYFPISSKLDHPGDRRRFHGFAKKKRISLSINKIANNKVSVITQNADLSEVNRNKEKYGKIIFDFCDGYLNEKISLRRIFRGTHKFISGQNRYYNTSYLDLLKKTCTISDAIVCASQIQMDAIKKYNNNIFLINDLINDEIKLKKEDIKINKKLKLVWEGLPSNLVHLENFVEIFSYLKRKIPLELHIISDCFELSPILKTKNYTEKRIKHMFSDTNDIYFHEWNMNSFSKIISNCDLAIIPSNKNYEDYFKFKSANKLKILWTIGVPVLCSSSEEHNIINQKTNLDIVCTSPKDWTEKIKRLYDSIDLRRKNVIIGRKYINKYSSDTKIIDTWNKVFCSINMPL